MVKRRFRCLRCGCKFEKEVFEPGEAEEKRRPSGPVRCPECKDTAVEEC
jgi:DNA-directed RNA polymerase subunit RPC12/RpoP